MNLIKSILNKVTFHVQFHLSKLERENIIAMIGMAIEYYTIFFYGYASTIIISQFFISSSPLILVSAILLSYIMGPIGAIICGHAGDVKGRKIILAWTIAFVSIPSFLISVLPTYDQIGVAASILFIILRSVQTLAFGGDAVGLVTFILEDAPAAHRGLFGGFMSMGSGIGVLVASLILSVIDPLEDPASPWKWRVPLSLGIIGIFLSIYFSKTLGETETFKHYKKKYYIRTWPLIDLFKKNKLIFLKVIGITALVPIITIIIFGFIPFLGSTHLSLSSKTSMWSNTIALVLFSLFAPFFGALSDRVGRRPLLFGVSIIYFVLGFPLFLLLEKSATPVFFVIQLFFASIASAYYGVTMATCIEHFPTHVRYTGVALGYYVTYTLFGGINGLYIVKFLLKDIHIDIAPVFYLLLGSFLVFLSTLFLNEEARQKLPETQE